MITYNDIVLWDKRLRDGSKALASKDISVVKSALSGVLSDMAYLVSAIESMMTVDEGENVLDITSMRKAKMREMSIAAGFDQTEQDANDFRGRRKAVGMSILTYTIAPERLAQIEEAVGFEIEDNRDMDYALEKLVENAWDK